MSSFILMTGTGSTVILIVLSLVGKVLSWSCAYAKLMQVIAGSWLVATRCAMARDKLRVGISRAPILKTAKELRRDCDRKTSLYVKKSTKPRCLKRSLEHLRR